MTSLADLGITFIENQQLTPEVTHNEAIVLLKTLLGGVLAVSQNAPPGSPADGDAYVIGGSPTGAWVGHDNKIAVWEEIVTGAAQWFFMPWKDDAGTDIAIGARHEGLMVYGRATDTVHRWDGSTWTLLLDDTAINMMDKILTRALIKDYTVESTAPAISSGTLTLDMANGNDFDVAWGEDITTITVSSWPPTGTLGKFNLRLLMDGTTRTVTWPAGWEWPDGNTPTDPGINEDLEVVVWSRDAGSEVHAANIGKNFN